MAERTERGVINHVIETCLDAERGFRTAADHVESRQLKDLFLRLADQRRAFADALLPHAQRLGGAEVGDGTSVAALHRRWIHVKARLARDKDRAVLNEAARGERIAVAVYDDAVHEMLSPDTREIVEAQDADVRAAAERVLGQRGKVLL